jgi:transcriptional regulator with XRE-family HTH domain
MNRLELRAWRNARYLSQPQLGALLGVNRMTVYRWESGDSTVPAFLDLALAQLDYLHSWSPDGIDALPRLNQEPAA